MKIFSKKFVPFYLVFLLLFSFAIRMYRIGEPGKYYFDEVYHVVTARAYSQNNPAAYDPFAPAPEENTAFDWLHPPLAKLIQATSIKIVGDNPTGWRLPSAIFGTAIVGATFVLGAMMFGVEVGLFAASVMAFENLMFVMSRITMNDVFVTFFVLLSFIFAHLYIKANKFNYLLLTSVALGLAASSKWSGFYAIFVIFVLVAFEKIRHKQFDFKIILLAVIPILIYFASYSQFWLQGHSVKQFIDLNKQIWWYQNRHDLEHSYGTTPLSCVPKGLGGPKTWCPWVLDVRGVYLSYEEYEQKAGFIYAIGNPLIFWGGIIAISYLVGKFLEEKRMVYLIVLLGYFIFWVPWIFSPRIMFLHHYLPSLPFMAISIGMMLFDVWKTKFKYLVVLILILFAAMFFFLYPISSGWPIDTAAIDKYMLLKTWR